MIVHLDADAFFASVEQASDPRLRGKPVAVGGEKRGIIASASYEARKFGVYTPMPTYAARRLCPSLIVLPGDFEKYEQFSGWMFSYAYDFTPDVEIGSIDEGYFDLSGARKSPLEIADIIRQAIRQSLKISVSEGIGSNKLVSQIASKLHKPAGFIPVQIGQETRFLHPLPNSWLPGVGPQTANRLNAAGLARIGQIAATPLELLFLLVGNAAGQLRDFANGMDERPIIPVRSPAKSYSQQETFAADITDEDFTAAVLRRMADRLMAGVRADGKSIRTVTVKVRYNDMAEDQCGESLAEPTDLETDLYARLRPLLRQAWKRRVSLRMVSLRFSNLYQAFFRAELPLESCDRQHEAQRRLAIVVDQLRQAHGARAILRGHDLLWESRASKVTRERKQKAESGDQRSEVGGQKAESGKRKAEDRRQRAEGEGQRAEMGEEYVLADRPLAVGYRPAAITAPATDHRPAIAYASPSVSGPTQSKISNRPSPIAHRPFQISNFKSRIVQHRFPVPLAVHSFYSFLDSTLSIEAIVALAKRHELPAIALTDRGNLHGAVEFVQAAQAAGIQPILGAEIKVNSRSLRLYVENAVGYRNLCRILSAAGEDEIVSGGAFHDSPGGAVCRGHHNWVGGTPALPSGFKVSKHGRTAMEPFPAASGNGFTDGLIAVSSDPQFAPLFSDRFYLAVSHPAALRDRAGGSLLPQVACRPIHYAAAADRWKYDVVQSIRTRTLLRQEHPDKRLDGDFHFYSSPEWRDLFRDVPALLDRSREIAERCTFELPLGSPQFPVFTPPAGSSPAAFLRLLVERGLRARYPARFSELAPQIEEELAIIHAVGYEGYFLVVWDLLQECRRRGIEWITRGSAADSLVCYCLEISDVCPIRFGLYFRRFLNRERMQLNKLPDIDVDFPHDRKDDVIDLVFAKYGIEHTAIVGGFSTYQARSAVGDVAKVLGVSEFQIRRLTERLPHVRPQALAAAVALRQECRDLPLGEEPYRTALDMAVFLDGFPRHPKMHPCGLVLSRAPMSELTPCFTSNKGYPTTHFDMDAVEAIGLVKMDILAQGGLAVMRDASRSLAARGIAVDRQRFMVNGEPVSARPAPPDEPWTDPAVWELIASGGARAVHHIESPAMIGLCRRCQARDIDGLIAIVSVIRPGAANENKKAEFVRRYQGLAPVTYPHPSLEPWLESTFGLVVYEEHILQICEYFAGLPAGRADVLRRALGKNKETVIEEIGKEFAACARARGHGEAAIAEVWKLAAGFSGYAFCKAHSTAYGVEAYQAAWLKRYFPIDFMAAVLSNGKGFYAPLVYVLECHRLGIPLLPPWVNEPGPGFAVVLPAPEPAGGTAGRGPQKRVGDPPPLPLGFAGAIRVPVTRVKGLTERTKERLGRERARGEFRSLADFYRRVAPANDEMEALIRVGAFDGFGKPRTTQFWDFQFLRCSFGDATDPGQGWLLPPPGADRLPEMPRREPSRRERLLAEAELLDFPVGGHPLELYDDIAWETYCPVAELGRHPGESVVTCGLVIEQRIHHQVTGEPMKFLTLADWTGMVETELFAPTYKSYGLATIRYPVLEVAATVEPDENGGGYSLRVHRAGKPRKIPAGGAASRPGRDRQTDLGQPRREQTSI